MGAAKSGKHIYISGLGNTLASVASDINDADYCVWDLPSKTLTVFGTAANIRYTRIRNGGELTIDAGETLLFNSATVDDTRFYIDANSIFNMVDDAVLDGSANGKRPYYWYFYGQMNIIGTGALRPTIRNFYRLYMYETSNGNGYDEDIWTFDNCIIGGAAHNNGYAIYLSTMGKLRKHTFRAIEFDETNNSNLDTYGIAFANGMAQGDQILLEDCIFTQTERGINNTGGWSIKSKNNIFGNISGSWSALHYGSPSMEQRDQARNFGYGNEKPYGQAFAMHEGDTFLAGNYANKILVSYGAVALIKDCDFQRTSGDAIDAQYRGRAMVWSGNTFADANPFDADQGGEISHVFRCKVTVLDNNGDPIEDSLVCFEQAEGKEIYKFTTTATGKLHAIHDLEGAMLTQRSQNNQTNGNGEIWASSSLLHSITVSKPGYVTKVDYAEMTADRDITIQITKESHDFSQSDMMRV